jgi:hypothetical protein
MLCWLVVVKINIFVFGWFPPATRFSRPKVPKTVSTISVSPQTVPFWPIRTSNPFPCLPGRKAEWSPVSKDMKMLSGALRLISGKIFCVRLRKIIR